MNKKDLRKLINRTVFSNKSGIINGDELNDVLTEIVDSYNKVEDEFTEGSVVITNPDGVFVESGYTINDLAMYKQGKHVWGTFVLSKDSGDLPSSQAAVATLKFIPSASMNSWCACSGNRYGGQPFYIGYMWAASGNGQILVCNPSGTTSGVNTAKIMLDYCID
jgi:hypothetical protein